MYIYLLVALGGALGSMARHACSTLAIARWGSAFPWGTILINIAGSFIIGFVSVLSDPEGRLSLSPEMRLCLMAGFCGGYTTFSSFSLQTLDLMQKGEMLSAGINALGSVALCLVAVWLGHMAAVSLAKSA